MKKTLNEWPPCRNSFLMIWHHLQIWRVNIQYILIMANMLYRTVQHFQHYFYRYCQQFSMSKNGLTGSDTIWRVSIQYILITSNMLYSFYRYCQQSSMSKNEMTGSETIWRVNIQYILISSNMLYRAVHHFQHYFYRCCQHFSIPWMRWLHLTPSVESAYSIFWSRKRFTGFSRSVRYRVYPVNHTLARPAGPLSWHVKK